MTCKLLQIKTSVHKLTDKPKSEKSLPVIYSVLEITDPTQNITW